MPRIGELLVAEGVLSDVAVQSALGFQRHTGEPFRLGTILLDRDLLAEENLLKALSAIHRCDYVTWPDILKTPPQIVRLLSERAAVRLAAVPYALEGRGVRVAFKNPSNLAAVDEVSAVTGRPVVPAVISEVRLLQAFQLFYGRPIPLEFRSVLHKLERNEERRALSHARHAAVAARGTLRQRARRDALAPDPDRARRTRRTPRARCPTPRPSSPPRTPGRELADAPDFLPDFEPAHAPTPDELADGMWRAARPRDRTSRSPRTMWERPVEAEAAPAPRAEVRSPARDRLAESTLETVCGKFPRAILFMSGPEAVQGWTARGAGLTRDRISAIRVPWGDPSIFAFVKLSGSPHRGALSRILVPPKLAALLGDKAAAACAVFPVRIKDRLVAFLYADRLGAPMNEDDYRSLEIASSALGSSLARLLMDLRRAIPN